MKRCHVLTLALSVFCLISTIAPPAAIAQASQGMQLAQTRRRALSWHVGVRPVRYRIGGYSRSGSCSSPTKLFAFVPPPRSDEKVGTLKTTVETTLAGHPTFWIYGSTLPPNAEVQFTLQDAAGKQELYNTQFLVQGQTGIFGVRLPKTVPELKVGDSYFWEAAVQCEPDSSYSNLISISGWVQRISPEQIKSTPTFNPTRLVQELAHAAERDKPALYAGLGVWQDAVTTLIDLQRKQPNNQELKEDWRSLLTEAQMSDWIDAPILVVK